jgi:hypothetical protein
MKTLDAEHLSRLQEIYNNTLEIQITKSFEQISKSSDSNTKIENN